MVFECGAIILVISVMAFMMLRSGKSSYALGVMPLVLVPVGHIMGSSLSKIFSHLSGISLQTIWVVCDVTALGIACILFGVVSYQMKKKRTRFAYLGLCGGFSAILTCVLIYHIAIVR